MWKKTVNDAIVYVSKHPGKAIEKVNDAVNDQLADAGNDAITLVRYAGTKKSQRTSGFVAKLMVKYGAFFLAPEEAELSKVSNTPSFFEYESAFKGGAKGDLLTGKVDGISTLEGNHLPTVNGMQQAGLVIPYNDASAIQMLFVEHRHLISTGRSAEAIAFRTQEAELLKSGKFMEAFDLNAAEIRKAYGDKYDRALQEARQYYEENIVPKLKEQQKSN